jgi:hypothetical protein
MKHGQLKTLRYYCLWPVWLGKLCLNVGYGARLAPEEEPIFVLGNQKSGTSAIAGLLGVATDLPCTIDFFREIRLPYAPFIAEGRGNLDDLIDKNRLDFSRKIIKEPSLTTIYPFLGERFPRAKFVFVVRDPRDNIRSILNRLRIPGDLHAPYNHWSRSLTKAWSIVMDSRYVGETSEHYIDALALRWKKIVRIYLEAKDKMLLMRYEDFRKDKELSIADLAQRLDLKVVSDISDKKDISFQVRGNSRTYYDAFFGENVERILRICEKEMMEIGYNLHAKSPCESLSEALSYDDSFDSP